MPILSLAHPSHLARGLLSHNAHHASYPFTTPPHPEESIDKDKGSGTVKGR